MEKTEIEDSDDRTELSEINQKYDKIDLIKNKNILNSHHSSPSASPIDTTMEKTIVPNLIHSFDAFSTSSSNFMFPINSANEVTTSIDRYRFQFCNYAMIERMRNQATTDLQQFYQPFSGCSSRLAFSLFQSRVFQSDEPKPQHSYIGLIAMAILSTPDQKLVLSDIYQHILDNYPYFRSRGPGWRNSIRHNLSLNDCFVKAGRSANGKGHYWAVHPANLEDFKKGDFRRRKAQRKVRKHMGLAVDEDVSEDDTDQLTAPHMIIPTQNYGFNFPNNQHCPWNTKLLRNVYSHCTGRKRRFDVASLLAHDDHDEEILKTNTTKIPQEEEDIDVEATHDLPCSNDIKIKEISLVNEYLNQNLPWNDIPYNIPLNIMESRSPNYYSLAAQHQIASKKSFVPQDCLLDVPRLDEICEKQRKIQKKEI